METSYTCCDNQILDRDMPDGNGFVFCLNCNAIWRVKDGTATQINPPWGTGETKLRPDQQEVPGHWIQLPDGILAWEAYPHGI